MDELAEIDERNTALIGKLLERKEAVHLIGIGGVGMAGLACLLHGDGISVSGTDCHENNLTAWLKTLGIPCERGHDARFVPPVAGWGIRSMAVRLDNPEVEQLVQQDHSVFLRGAALAAYTQRHRSIAVSGTHGKTSTSALIAHVLHTLEGGHGYFVGAEGFGKPVAVSPQGDGLFVTEADESDGTVSLYHPDTAVLTNVEYDHMEHFESRADMEAHLICFARQARRCVICCGDDPFLQQLVLEGEKKTYGLQGEHDVSARAIQPHDNGIRYLLQEKGGAERQVELQVFGQHNVLNSMAAYLALRAYGIAAEDIIQALASFPGVRRRFEVCGSWHGAVLISDYAHHPTEIRAVVQTARQRYPGRRINVVFQPHRYTRTLALKTALASCWKGVDRLYLCPVFAASEDPLPGEALRIC